jgi:DNA-binding NarL/FixJ family response regulator
LLIRVLIADDHDIVRKGVRNLLLSRPGVEVSGEAADGKEAIDLALNLKPDVIILDLSMPVLGGFAAAVELHRLLPETPIIFYSMHDGPHLVKQAKQIGVRGFVNKSRISETLTEAIDAVVVRKQPFFPGSQ